MIKKLFFVGIIGLIIAYSWQYKISWQLEFQIEINQSQAAVWAGILTDMINNEQTKRTHLNIIFPIEFKPLQKDQRNSIVFETVSLGPLQTKVAIDLTSQYYPEQFKVVHNGKTTDGLVHTQVTYEAIKKSKSITVLKEKSRITAPIIIMPISIYIMRREHKQFLTLFKQIVEK